nr:hypothetical protein B0A51_02990 [Rachicladosporium sp. CCFEE 5018]
MPAKSMVDFCKLIDNLDLHGNEIFQVYGREVSYFDATSDANTLVDSTRGTYSDSVHMFQVSAALIRLRGHTTGGTYVTEGADTGDEISDARILFGSSIQVERVVDGWLSDAQASGDEGASS